MKITTSFNDIIYQTQYLEATGLKFSSLGDMATFIFYAISILTILISSGFKFFSNDIFKKIYINKNDILYKLVSTIVVDILILIVSSLCIFIIIYSIDTFEKLSNSISIILSVISIILSVISIVFLNDAYIIILKNIDKKNFNKELIPKKYGLFFLIKLIGYSIWPIFILLLTWDDKNVGNILLIFSVIFFIISICVTFVNVKEALDEKMTMGRSFLIFNIFLFVYSFYSVDDKIIIIVIGTATMFTYLYVSQLFFAVFCDRYNKEGTYIIYTTNNYEEGENTKYLTNEIDNNQDFICFYEINNGNDLIILNKSCIHKIELKNNNN